MTQADSVERLKRWGRKFLADWKAGTGGGKGQGPASPQNPQGHLAYMLTQNDCWPAHVEGTSQSDQLHRLVIGVQGGDLYLMHPPPEPADPGKDDVLRATGLVRARLGRVWQYSPDGAEIQPGCVEHRWSPIPPSNRCPAR
jgi:hypothetical protein